MTLHVSPAARRKAIQATLTPAEVSAAWDTLLRRHEREPEVRRVLRAMRDMLHEYRACMCVPDELEHYAVEFGSAAEALAEDACTLAENMRQ